MSTVLDAPEDVGIATLVASPAPPKSERLVALDVFRGATIAGMLLVNNPGTWSAIYPPLDHAKWDGWTPTDLIFPFFLFIVGITTHLSLRRRAPNEIVPKILRRGLLIILVGLLLNWFPFFWPWSISGNPDPTLWQRVIHKIEHLRYSGVLQRIGVAYMAAALLTLRTTRRQQVAIATALLIGYWMILMLVPVPGTGTIGAFTFDQPARTLEGWVDRTVIGTNHIWSQDKYWDPEGILSTLGAITTAMLGIFAGRWIADKRRSLLERIAGLFGAGSLAMVLGSLWSWALPINKNLWTPSYVVFTAGFACVALGTCLWLVDVLGVRGWIKPFVVYGVNPLIAFAGSGLMAIIAGLWKVRVAGKVTSLQHASYILFFQPYFPDKFASLLWALCFVALWLGILSLFYRRNIIIRL